MLERDVMSATIATCGRPNAGVVQWGARHGCRASRTGPWMARCGGPTEQCRSEGSPSEARTRTKERRPFGYFWLGRQSGRLPKVTRRKGGTILQKRINNGYVLRVSELSDSAWTALTLSRASSLLQIDQLDQTNTGPRNNPPLTPRLIPLPHLLAALLKHQINHNRNHQRQQKVNRPIANQRRQQ